MLVLSRKVGERVHIGGSVVVTIVATKGRSVRVGIEAPQSIEVLREELSGAASGGEAWGRIAVDGEARSGGNEEPRERRLRHDRVSGPTRSVAAPGLGPDPRAQ